MREFVKVVLKSGKDESVRRYHPWVFSGAIKKIYGNPVEGDMVEVFDNKEEFLGVGHYGIGSIAVRIFSFVKVEPDAVYWQDRIAEAWAMRKSLRLSGTVHNDIYRLVHGEGDGMPGLIIDVYGKTAVVQMHSVGMYKLREVIIEGLKNAMGDDLVAIYDKSEGTLPHKANVGNVDGLVWGNNDSSVAVENGLKFFIDYEKGQKTGFFVDQRDNRSLVETLAHGKKVLNMFCYTGGFSVYAMRGGAELVHSVDSSARAIDLTNDNMNMNFPGDVRHNAYAVDAFKYLIENENKYDFIILDPPAFAKHRDVVSNAMNGYKRLNAKAMEVIEKGGILFTFSCSQVVTRDLFRKAIFQAAAMTGRKVKILYQLSQPADHPVNIYHPEGEYLKGLVLQVD